MGELRLYAVGVDEVRGLVGAPQARRDELHALATQAFAPPPTESRGGLIGKLGPLFRRPPATRVVSPTEPEPADVDALLAGTYIRPERTGASWRVLEALVAGTALGSTRFDLAPHELDDLDFALARGGVSASVGLRHLLGSPLRLNLLPVQGLHVGFHRYEVALAMAGAYRAAMPQIKTPGQQQQVAALAGWLDGFVPWAQQAVAHGRPVPDLLGFYAA